MSKNQSVSCPFFRMFPAHCIPDVTEDFDVHFYDYSTLFWIEIAVDETLNDNKETLQFKLAFSRV